MAPRCFLSYSRENWDPLLKRFFDNLRDEIVAREDVEKDEAVFLDWKLPTGSDWESDIGEALRESWACVTIYTPSFFHREYCGKEFQVFLDRAKVNFDEQGAALDARGIFPILWSREVDLKKKGLPPVIAKRINYTGKEDHERYVREGLRQILQGDPQGLYLKLLFEIANDLADNIFPNHPDPLPARPKFDQTPNAFQKPGIGEEQQTQPPSPFHFPVFLLTAVESTSAFSLSEAKKWLPDLEVDDFTIQIEAVYPVTDRPERLMATLDEAGSRNAQSIVILDPFLLSEGQTLPTQFLDDILKAKFWQGALLLPMPKDEQEDAVQVILGNELSVPEAVVVSAVSSEVEAFSNELRKMVIDFAKRLAEEGDRKRSLSHNVKPGKRPQIQGPQK
jgi:TIR domain-containing protein